MDLVLGQGGPVGAILAGRLDVSLGNQLLKDRQQGRSVGPFVLTRFINELLPEVTVWDYWVINSHPIPSGVELEVLLQCSHVLLDLMHVFFDRS